MQVAEVVSLGALCNSRYTPHMCRYVSTHERMFVHRYSYGAAKLLLFIRINLGLLRFFGVFVHATIHDRHVYQFDHNLPVCGGMHLF